MKGHALLFDNLNSYLAMNHPFHVTTCLQVTVDHSICENTAAETVDRILDLCSRGAHVLRACDAKFTTFLTIPRLTSLIRTCAASTLDFQAKLLDILRFHSSVLSETPVHLIPLLEELLSQSPDTAPVVAQFSNSVVAWLQTDKCDVFLDRLVRALPFVQQVVTSTEVVAQYVAAIAKNVHSNAERTYTICQAFLLLNDLGTNPSLNVYAPSAVACLDLLAADLQQSSVASEKKQRALDLMHQTIHQTMQHHPDAPMHSTQSCTSLSAWSQSLGIPHWQLFLTLAATSDVSVSVSALKLMCDIPYPPLEDPLWQYRCLHDLLRLFFRLLERLDADANPVTLKRIDMVKAILTTIMQESGGVVSYPASVATTFLCLLVDAVVSPASPTTVPHEVPQEMNFFRGKDAKGNVGQAFRKLTATNRLRPYNPFPKPAALSSESREGDVDVFSQLQSMRSNAHHMNILRAPSQFESYLVAARAEEMQRAVSCSGQVEDLLYHALNLTSFPDGAIPPGNALVDILLERTLPVSMFIPPDDHYRVRRSLPVTLEGNVIHT
ncbi:hypothetical protein DYB32_002392 [Aphanomyces invadans]|uniref:Uncharacterized protein n=1 Tax=Aphanomyces invadans TaxID=157072 RepID=A0A418B9I7_9STRA|nr:hypothetical protein DYB32_002392 [Aphanomyces invadans]